MEFNTIIYEENVQEGIAKITMNRPEKRNAINKEMIVEMHQAFHQAENNDQIRVIILNGNGSCFSAGHDLSASEALPESVEDIIRVKRRYYLDELLYIRNLRKPIIAQIHSYCVAAGLVLATMADILIASNDAIFSDPVVRMGANSQELIILPWLLGEKKAKEILFTGDRFTALEAYNLGMVNQIVSRDELDDKVNEMAKKIALMPPMTLSLVKESINNTMDIMGYTNSMKMHFNSHLLSLSTREITEGMDVSKRDNIKNFIEKRDGFFK
jgi:enoyl-CoA hydratase